MVLGGVMVYAIASLGGGAPQVFLGQALLITLVVFWLKALTQSQSTTAAAKEPAKDT
jgi:hypothetical protein